MSPEPMTPIAFDILLCLAEGDAHGYGIMQSLRTTRGAGRLHAGTLYRALARLVDSGHIEEVEEGEGPSSDERRRYYAITDSGRSAARAEARQLAKKVGAARALGLLEPVAP